MTLFMNDKLIYYKKLVNLLKFKNNIAIMFSL
jgi:hypothetical protein